MAQDQYGDLLVADAANRVEFYYPGLASQNAASYFTDYLAPGVLATIYPLGVTFSTSTANSNQQPNPVPYPMLLADTQVLFNGQPAPVLLVSPGQINFMIPMSAPTSGNADVQVVRNSTGQILTDGLVAMNSVSPAIFAGGCGQLLAGRRKVQSGGGGERCRRDCQQSQQPGRGWFLHFHLRHWTGLCAGRSGRRRHSARWAGTDFGIAQGLDQRLLRGRFELAPGKQASRTYTFSGLSPQFPGVWQINVRIPKNTGPGAQVPLFIVMNNYNQPGFQTGYVTTIAVKNQ